MFPGNIKVYISRERVDLRKSYEGLGLLVQGELEMNPLSGFIFVFFNRDSNKVKALYWDRNGFCIWQKRLEKGTFRIPSIESAKWELSFQDLQIILAGFDISKLPRRQVADYSNYVVN